MQQACLHFLLDDAARTNLVAAQTQSEQREREVNRLLAILAGERGRGRSGAACDASGPGAAGVTTFPLAVHQTHTEERDG